MKLMRSIPAIAFCSIAFSALLSAAPAESALRAQVASPADPRPAQLAAPGGVTILESRDLQAQLEDVRKLLKENSLRAAIGSLQRVLEADPASLVRVESDDLLFRGAGQIAAEILADLPEQAMKVRESMVGGRAAEELLFALNPPDLHALREITKRYTGTRAALDAAAALRELLFDRGLHERAASGRKYEELMPPAWIGAMPAPKPLSLLRTPAWSRDEHPTGLAPVHAAGLQARWRYQFADSPVPHQNYSNHRAAIGAGLVYLSDSKEVVALELGTGAIRWRFDSPPGWERFSLASVSGRRNREAITDAFDPDTIIAPVLADGVLLVNLQEAVSLGRADNFFEIAVRRLLPGRRLYAFDADNGDLLWVQDVPWMNFTLSSGQLQNARQSPVDMAAAPPTVAAGRVFLPVYSASGTLDLSMIALDLHSGEELWRSFLVSGSKESNLFGNVLTELACPPPVADASMVIMCSNLGAICALDAATGAAKWTRLYERSAVQVSQNGDISQRRDTFSNHPPAWDGQRLLCAPTDSPYALLMSSSSGELQGLWPARSSTVNERVELDQVVALMGNQVLMSGTHVQRKTIGASVVGNWSSERLFNQFSSIASRRAAVLSQHEILVPTGVGLMRLNPETGRAINQVAPWPGNMSDFGTIQTVPGSLLVLRKNGVLVLSSIEGILAALPKVADNQQIASLLPMLEAINFEHEGGQTSAIAARSLMLAADSNNVELQERLRLVAMRALSVTSPDSDSCQQLVLGLLNSNNPSRVAEAALSALERLPAGMALNQAVAALEQGGIANLSKVSTGELAMRMNLARTKLATASGNNDAMRKALVELIISPASKHFDRNGTTLDRWAETLLNKLLEQPGQLAALEQDARGVLGDLTPSAELMRAYRRTEVINTWLQQQLKRNDRSVAESIALARATRQLGALPPTLSKDLAAWCQRNPLSTLPTALQPLAELTLDGDELLAVGPGDSGLIRVLQKSDQTISLSEADATGWKHLADWTLDDAGKQSAALVDSSWLVKNGAVLIHKDKWIHLANDGAITTLQLPAPLDLGSAPTRIGNVLALLCTDADNIVLQVREMTTGGLIYQYVFPFEGANYLLSASGTTLFCMVPGSNLVTSFDIITSTEPRRHQLPMVVKYSDAFATVSSGDGLLTTWSSKQNPGVMRSSSQGINRWDMSRHATVRTFASKEGGVSGAGWVGLPLVPGRGEFPSPQISWLVDGASEPVILTMDDHRSLLPQFSSASRRARSLRRPEILSLGSGTAGATRLSAFKLDENLNYGWSVLLPNIPFRNLVSRRLPAPLAAANGWLIPLIVSGGLGQAPRLDISTVSDNGELQQQRLNLVVSTRSREISLYLIDSMLIVRNSDTLMVYGKP